MPLALVACLMVPPALAQEAEPEDGRSLMERGADLFLRGLRDEMDPALRGLQDLATEMGPALQGFLQQMGPALSGILDEVEDWSRYEPPVMLPNGDILIRRKPDAEPLDPEDAPNDPMRSPEPGEEIEI
ncbi:hypothetical protein ACFSDD_14920 [Salipiger marinus]|uniref:hypothetical protein n=2 Tax=Salipiger marinus TaxID=555512 RepID=UPI002B901821|nr:hypothetical protein [Salipiger manganoxidans]MEB3418219.1 hypothetical protein [Salipiger manganoxidans]